MKALILAAGYATRLYPLTKEYPKPLLMIGERPIIDYIIDRLEVIAGLDEIIVVTNSKFIAIFRKWARRLKVRKRVSLVDDLTHNQGTRRGAIGDINFTIRTRRMHDDLLVVGGDNLFDNDLSKFLSFAIAKAPHSTIGVYDIKDMHKAKKYGLIELGRDNKVIEFQEKPEKPKSTLVAMCLYYFPKEKLGLVQKYLESKADKHDATGFYIDWLSKKEPVYGFLFKGCWYDIGHHSFYNEAKERFAKKE